jgi:hypothetical protein
MYAETKLLHYISLKWDDMTNEWKNNTITRPNIFLAYMLHREKALLTKIPSPPDGYCSVHSISSHFAFKSGSSATHSLESVIYIIDYIVVHTSNHLSSANIDHLQRLATLH